MSAGATLAPLEVAAGLVTGLDPAAPGWPGGPPATPRVALEAAIRPALQRPPCVVAFSGGRDSSGVLAVAAALARREGLEPPVAATNRFPASPGADEVGWQEAVVRHLKLADWVRLDHGDDLDAVGPVAAGLLRRHGILWPFNSHFLSPLAAVAAGGSVLTGAGGDEVIGWPWPGALAVSLVRGSTRPSRRRLAHIARAAAPGPARRALERRATASLPWLRPAAARQASRAAASWHAAAPARFDRCLREWWWPGRYLQVALRSLATVAGERGAAAVHPLADPGVLAALARARGWRGFRSRREAMATLFGDVLEPEVLVRPDKAAFAPVFVGGPARAFVAGWTGGGIDPAIVDATALRRAWSAAVPDARSLLLLQAVWLATQPATAADGAPGRRG